MDPVKGRSPKPRSQPATVSAEPRLSRAQKAAQTRLRMLDAAYDQFCEHGFRATTMEAVAEQAGVAVQTLYFTFHTKDALLQEVLDRAVLGDDPVVPADQPWFAETLAEPDVVQAIGSMVAGVCSVLARVAPLIPVFHAVSGDPAGAVFRHAEDLRRDGYRDLVDALASKASLRPGVGRHQAVDLVFVLLGPEVYRSLVIGCSWPEGDYVRWVSATLARDLFDRERPQARTKPRR